SFTWAGRIYGPGGTYILARAGRIYHGTLGTAPFQALYQPAPTVLAALVMMPEWYVVIAALAGLAVLGTLWAPLLLSVPLLALAVGAPLAQAGLGAAHATFPPPLGGDRTPRSRVAHARLRALTALLHLLQPLARLRGRQQHGLTPWRRVAGGFALPWPRSHT